MNLDFSAKFFAEHVPGKTVKVIIHCFLVVVEAI